MKTIYTRNHANRHTSTVCDNRCLVNRIDTVDIFAAYLFVTVNTIDLNTTNGRDVTHVPGRVAASGSHPSRVKTRLSPIYVHQVSFVCELAVRSCCQVRPTHDALCSFRRCTRLRLKCDGTRAEARFRLSAKRTSPFKSAGTSVQSTTGSRGYASAVVMLDAPCSEVV